MTDPVVDFSDAPEPTPVEAPRRRGRPRSPETIERDARVFAALTTGPLTKEQLVAELGMRPQLVYLSLWRLKREGRVDRAADGTARHTWQTL